MSVWHRVCPAPLLLREREMNGMVIHSKVNENPGSLLVHLSGQRGGDEYGHATAEIRADAIKRDCLLFLIQWEGPWR